MDAFSALAIGQQPRLCENVPKNTWSGRICRGGDTVRKYVVKDDKDKDKDYIQ